MPTGQFTIGDLAFTFGGSLKELARCQEIIREINQAEYRLKKASGSDQVKVIYDQDLEGEQGTFDKMRLRAYDDSQNYTLDIGTTDNNPLGIYVGYDQNIEVYDRETGETWEITPEGDEIGKPSQTGKRPSQSRQQAKSTSPRGGSRYGQQFKSARQSSVAGKPDGSRRSEAAERMAARDGVDAEEALKVLVKQASVHPDQNLAGETTVGKSEEPLDQKIRDFAKLCDRDGEYIERVKVVQNFESASDLPVGRLEETLHLILSEERLRRKERGMRNR